MMFWIYVPLHVLLEVFIYFFFISKKIDLRIFNKFIYPKIMFNYNTMNNFGRVLTTCIYDEKKMKY